MGESYKLDSNGTCQLCNEVSQAEENLQCFMCNESFHCACPQIADDDEKVGTVSLITQFNRKSTKGNFKFFCHECATNMETNRVNTETNRLNVLEKNMFSITEELKEIKELMKKDKPKVEESKQGNIWFNKDKLVSTKAPTEAPKIMLVINDSENLDKDSIEKAIVEQQISVTNIFQKNGELSMVCDSTETRDRLKNIIASTTENVQIKSVPKKKPSITIVGLNQKYKNEDLVCRIVSQNQFIKDFSTVNKIEEHFEIHDIKPTRSNQLVYQVFATVSETLRNGLKNYKDKIVIGLTTCKIYDRQHIKRCNNCQGHGHYYKECPTPNEHYCAKCSLQHATKDCDATLDRPKCINCVKAGIENKNHAAYDHRCPTRLNILKKKKNANNLNIRR